VGTRELGLPKASTLPLEHRSRFTAGMNRVLPNDSPERSFRYLAFALEQRILFIGYNIYFRDMSFVTSSGNPFKSKERETKTNPARVGKLIRM
jgi:hypothetical protein